jgi:glycosyltransferase involved in cell wall biosynthesis/phosphoglycolate phosphatase-like HAD superfamily hydrolase
MIVFDLDGTLIDITERWFALHERYARLHGLPIIEKEEYIALKKEAVPERDIFLPRSINEESFQNYQQERIAHIEDDEFLAVDVLVTKCKELLEAWRAVGEIQIVTNRKNKESCERELERFGVLPSIAHVHFATDDTRAEVVKQLHEHEKITYLISDSLDDNKIAKELRIPVITVGYGCRSAAYFAEQGVTDVIEDTEQLINLASHAQTVGKGTKLRVAIDTTYMDRRGGKGTAIVIRHTIEEMLKYREEFDITLIHREAMPEDAIYKEFKEIIIPRVRLPKFSKFFSELWFFLSTREQFDIYYFSYSRIYPTFWLAPAKKIVFAAMDGGPETAGYTEAWAKGKLPWYVRVFLSKVDAFVAITEFGKKGIVTAYGVPPKKVHVVYNGVDEQFKPATLPKEEIRSILKEKYNFPPTYILCVSRFDPHKNILRLLEAYKKIIDDGFTGYLVFVGGRHMPEYSNKIDQLIESLDLKERVFIAPHIEEGDMPLVYQASELLIFPSLYEGFGLPIIEALACGVPVVSSHIDALKEVSGGHALFIDPYDISAITKGLKEGYSTPREVIEEGISWSKKFTWDAHGKKIAEVFKDLWRE